MPTHGDRRLVHEEHSGRTCVARSGRGYDDPACRAPAPYRADTYVERTGKRPAAYWLSRSICLAHGTSWALKHGVQMPEDK